MKRVVSLIALLALASCVSSAPPSGGPALDPPLQRALDSIHADSIRSHVEFLADDLLEGRETGKRGYDLAAAYVAAQFRAAGLEPTSSGSYFQPVQFRTGVAQHDKASLVLTHRDGTSETLQIFTDYIVSPDPARPDATAEGDVVFAGYGITAPELHHDDYQGTDVRGKIVALLAGAPASFASTERAYYSDSTLKARNAADRGAVGMILFRPPTEQKRVPWDRVVDQTKRTSMLWVSPSGDPFVAVPEIRATATLSGSGAQKLLAGSSLTLDEVEKEVAMKQLQPIELPVHVRIHRETSTGTSQSENVVGILRSSDPTLRNEYIVISAHLDHLGINSEGDDRINNGALDNASGVATIIEIARALGPLQPKLRRSILFVALTGEEKGELGSDYFARFPTVPKEQLAADINIDMFQMIFPIADFVSRGQEHSSLERQVNQAATMLHETLSPDPEPEQVRFVRSDQYSFTKQGIPSLIIKAGFRSLDPAIDGPKKMQEWTQHAYHTPSDDTKQPIDYPSGVRFARLNALVAFLVATDVDRPSWKPGDFFGERLGRK